MSLRPRRSLAVPFSTPALLLNRYSMAAFNQAYYLIQRRRPATQIVHYEPFFFPLDGLRHWNRLYGKQGFLQYQLVLPTDSASAGLQLILEKVAASGRGSFLAVLKQFGDANKNLLSFPRAGYTLSLDFKHEPALFPFLEELDAIVIDHGGRLYLAKDARMNEAIFKAGYPEWERFLAIKKQVDPAAVFSSQQSRRLGLDHTTP